MRTGLLKFVSLRLD